MKMFFKTLFLFVSLLKFSISDDVLLSVNLNDEKCSSESQCDDVTFNCDELFSVKNKNEGKKEEIFVTLKDVMSSGNENWRKSDSQKMFFVESSGRNHLTPRQACSVESALRNSALDYLIVAMTSKELHVGANNATCRLYNLFATSQKMTFEKKTTDDRTGVQKTSGNGTSGQETSGPRLFFVHVNVDTLFTDASIQNLHQNGKLKAGGEVGGNHAIVHYSDAIRLYLIRHFGGWYSDLDMVILRDLTHLRNVIASDGISAEESITNPTNYGQTVSNAIFHFDRGHVMLNKSLEVFSQIFDGTWGSAGPQVLSQVLKHLCNFQPKQIFFDSRINTKENCQGIEILPPKSFYPVGWFASSQLWLSKSWSEWEELFKDSYTAHFYQSSSKTVAKVMKKKFYGNAFPAYLPLAMQHCPISFYSERMF